MEAEDLAAEEAGLARIDPADAAIAVLDRERELALLERCPHRPLARRDTAGRHQRSLPRAHPGAHPHPHLARPGRRQPATAQPSPCPGAVAQ